GAHGGTRRARRKVRGWSPRAPPRRDSPLARGLPAARARPAAGHLAPRPPRLRQADRDRLLAARDLLAGPPRPERAVFPFVHGALDLLGGLRAVALPGSLLPG